MKILHLAITEFYLTVERAKRNIPPDSEMIIHFPEEPGFVVTQSAGVHSLGVRPSMLLEKARKIAPEAQYVEADYQAYGQISEHLNTQIRDLYPFTEQLDLYEWFCDLTDEGDSDARAALERIVRARYPFQMNLSVSNNKFLAKLGNDTGRAFGPERAREELNGTSIDHFWGIPQRWIKDFKQMGIEMIGEVGGLDPQAMEKKYPNVGRRLVRLGQGDDDHEVHPFAKPTRLSRNGRMRLGGDESATKKFIEGLAGELSEQLLKGGHATFAMYLDVMGGGQKVSHRYRFLIPTVRASSILVGAMSMLRKARHLLPDGEPLDINLSVAEIVYDRESYQLHGSPRADLEVMTD